MGTEKIKRTLCLGTQQKLSVLLNPRFLRVDISIPCLACAQKSLHLIVVRYFRCRISAAADLAAFLISERGRTSGPSPGPLAELSLSERMSALAAMTQSRLFRACVIT